jgi:hypothetical protein
MLEPMTTRSDRPPPDRLGWTDCPGCGVALPGTAVPVDRRRNASPACWHLYGEVVGYELTHLAELGRLHQLTVDTYGAQHAGPSVPAIGTAFALIGLWLALEEGMGGIEVRSAHQYLAGHFSAWPTFVRPFGAAGLTVFDVASAESIEDHARLVGRWAADVWVGWRPAHDAVRRVVQERFPSAIRGSLASGG